MQQSLSINSEIQELQRVFEWLDQVLGAQGPVTQDFKVVCDELLSNIIHYGLDDNSHCVIELALSIDHSAVQLHIIDQARPFNPLARTTPDLEIPVDERDIGGLGIALTCSLTDDQHYRYEDGRNYLTVIKKTG